MYGIISPKESKISSLRYKKDVWTEAEAKAHCKSRKGKFEPAKKDIDDTEVFLTTEQFEQLLGKIKPLIKINSAIPKTYVEILSSLTEKQRFELGKLIDEEVKKNEIDLESIEDEKNVEIELDKLESSQAGLENSGDEIEITEEEYQKLLTDIKKMISEGFTGEFRKKILGIVDD